ncbi:LolA family protein [Microvirga sp. G4-2]|uniref:LolA family protein n=1 Tax=Microvirga sp. G4-2 TaxID=3434467 RepID=UPI004044F877
MLKKSLRCFIGLAVLATCASPAAAQQRTPDPLTRFLDGIFKPNQGQGTPTAEPQTAPAPQAAEPAPAAPAQTQTKPQAKTAAPKPKAPAKQQVARPKPQAQPQAQPVAAAPATAPKPAPAEPDVKQAAPATAEPPAQAAEKPKAPEPAPVKVAEPPKPARSTPAQAAPTPTPVAAAATPATPVSPPNPTSPAAALERVNAYFNSMDTMSAYFVQKNPNGQQVEGTLTVRRPGQLHFAYAPPSTLEIVSDGRNVAIRDKKLGTNDVYPVSQTPLKFLLQDNVDLARDTKVRDVQIARDGVITVIFDDSATLGGTSKITLRFDSRANALKQWTVVDSQGYETTVVLSGLNVVQRRNASAAD